MQTIGDKAHANRADFEKQTRGIPSTANIKDPHVKAVLDALIQNNAYLMTKAPDWHRHDVQPPAHDQTKAPGRYVPPVVPAPAAPVLSAWAGQTLNYLTWPSISGATAYNLYWSLTTPVTSASTKIAGVASPYSHTGITMGTRYYYALTAVGAGGESALSGEVSVKEFSGVIQTKVTEGNSDMIGWGGMGGYNTIYYPGDWGGLALALADCEHGLYANDTFFGVPPTYEPLVLALAGKNGLFFYNAFQWNNAANHIEGFCVPSFRATDGYPYVTIEAALPLSPGTIHFEVGYDH